MVSSEIDVLIKQKMSTNRFCLPSADCMFGCSVIGVALNNNWDKNLLSISIYDIIQYSVAS